MSRELKDGKRKQISRQDVLKSLALERALYPIGIRYPKAGDIYLCIEEAPISYMTHWAKPYTGGDKALFPKEEKITISDITLSKPTSVYCTALNANKIEQLLVPRRDREQLDYDGYSLVVDTLTLNRNFKLIKNKG